MPKVLIIDNAPQEVQELRQALAGVGVDCDVTGDGNEGLTLARTYQPNAIILCVELPRVSGYSICNKLKKDPALLAIPLLLTSSQATEETFEQHKKLKTRAEAYLKKPYEMRALLAVLGPLIGLRAAAPLPMDDDETRITTMPAVAPPKAAPRPVVTPMDSTVDDLGLGLDFSALDAAIAPASPAPKRAMAARAFDIDEDLVAEPAPAVVPAAVSAPAMARPRQKSQPVVVPAEPARPAAPAGISDADARQLRQQIQQLEAEVSGKDQEIAQLNETLGTLHADKQTLAAQLQELQQAQSMQSLEQDNAAKSRTKAKRAVEIAMQLIDETGLLPPA